MSDIDAINKKYSFSSIGETDAEELERIKAGREQAATTRTDPYGFKFPLKLNRTGDGFAIHSNREEAISDNLHHLILTNHGERVGNYYFGANLTPLLLEGVSLPNFNALVGRTIRTAIENHMPYLQPQEFSVNFIPQDNSPVQKVEINLSYLIPLFGDRVYTKRVTMYLGA